MNTLTVLEKKNKSLSVRLPIYTELMLFKEYITYVKNSLGFTGKVSHTEAIELLLKEFMTLDEKNHVTVDSKQQKYHQWLNDQSVEELISKNIKGVTGLNFKFKCITVSKEVYTKLINLLTYVARDSPYKIDLSYIILILLNRYLYQEYTTMKLSDDYINQFIEWEKTLTN